MSNDSKEYSTSVRCPVCFSKGKEVLLTADKNIVSCPECSYKGYTLAQVKDKGKYKLICAYCTKSYIWINHNHTRGFYEHQNPDCRLYMHKILEADTELDCDNCDPVQTDDNSYLCSNPPKDCKYRKKEN